MTHTTDPQRGAAGAGEMTRERGIAMQGITMGCVCHFRDEHPSGVWVACDGRCGRDPEAKRQVDLWVNGITPEAITELRREVEVAKERRGFALVDPWVLSRLIGDATRKGDDR